MQRSDKEKRRAAVMDEAAEAGESIGKAWSFACYKAKITSLRRPDGTLTASRRAMENIIYDFYSDLFDSHCTSLFRTLGGRIYRSSASPFRNSTCHHVDEELYGTQSRWYQTRTSKESSTLHRQNPY
uniref:Uncharacterized protein n=1 Tax=Haemonchus contortus TaxID=6289 RepID=A0A7I4YVY5_HAECO